MTTARADHVAALRTRVLSFLAEQTQPVDKAAIKAHLGLEPYKVNGWLDQALKSRRIHVQRYHPCIGGGKGLTLYAGTPVSLYSLAAKEGSQ